MDHDTKVTNHTPDNKQVVTNNQADQNRQQALMIWMTTFLFELVLAGRVKIDTEDLEKYGKWQAQIYTNEDGYQRLMVWDIKEISAKQQLLSKLILPVQAGFIVDHANRDTLDCRRSNLRQATYAQNSANSKLRKHNTSGYKGVSFNKRRQKFEANINFEGTRYPLGFFDVAEEAAKAYDKVAKRLHGEFAVLNFPINES